MRTHLCLHMTLHLHFTLCVCIMQNSTPIIATIMLWSQVPWPDRTQMFTHPVKGIVHLSWKNGILSLFYTMISPSSQIITTLIYHVQMVNMCDVWLNKIDTDHAREHTSEYWVFAISVTWIKSLYPSGPFFFFLLIYKVC